MYRWLSFLLCLLAGPALSARGSEVFPADAVWKYLPARSEASPADLTSWRRLEFDDSSWPTGQAPFFYDDQPESTTAYTGNTPLPDMRGNYSSLFLRKTFLVTNPKDVQQLELRALSDDGFIAWINGAEVARFNMPDGDIRFDGTSLSALPEPVLPEKFQLTQDNFQLVSGTNVIALQAFNSSLGSSSDFVIWAALSSSVDSQPPAIKEVIPPEHALLQSLSQVEVIFTEDVTGVDASDLMINGQPATKVTAFNASQYIFEFAQPASGPVTLDWSNSHGIRDLASTANKFTGGLGSYTLDPNAAPPGLMISEFMADNRKTLHDEDGDGSDWIELFNAGVTTVSLSGYSLSGPDKANRWRFPNITLRPNSYLLVFASGKDRTNATAQLHTNFKLDKDGGGLSLWDPAGKAISEFLAYPPQLRDVSYGRDRSNPTRLAYFPKPTPGAPNASGGSGFSPPVQFSRAGGTFTDAFALELVTAATNAAIHYSLDGTVPTETAPIYLNPLLISTTVQVRAQSYTPELLPGPPHSESYLALSNNVVAFSSDLPVLAIHNFGAGTVPAGSRQLANFSVFEPGAGRTSLTNPPSLSIRAGLNLRGSSTLSQTKSNFRVEFWDEFDDPQNAPLLGLPEDNDWVLYACNNFDPVLIHNPFMHDLSRQIGRYSPRTRMVEVYVNTSGGPLTRANYFGVYVLLEKIKVGKDRVDIAKLEPEHSHPPQLTGGYLLSIDRSAPGEGQIYASGLGFNALSPKWDELIQSQRAPQISYITDYLDNLYTVLNRDDFADPVNGYAKYFDVPAAIDHHVLNVLAFNVDALRLSAFLFKPRDGKLTFGPLWDFDRALGSTDGRDSNPRTWRSFAGDRGTDMFNSDPIFFNPWYSRMFQDPDFWQRWIDRWQELRRSTFSLTNLHGLVDSLANQVREAEIREFARWSSFTAPRGGTYQAEVDRMKNWLSNRVDFIDTNFLAAPRLSRAGGPVATGTEISLSGPEGSALYYTLDGTDPRASGGAVAASAHPYTSPIALNQNARVVARAWDAKHRNLTGANKPPLSSPWSGPAAATYVVSQPALLITELMYHPASPAAGDTNDTEQFEFVELKNAGSQTLSLAGFRFTQGIDYVFTGASAIQSLGAGQYAVLVKNRSAFSARYPGVTNVAGEYSGSLDNSGERITFEGPLQEPIQDFVFRTEWYPATDGPGFSLVPSSETPSPNDWGTAARWKASHDLNGSPGRAEPGESTPHIDDFSVERGVPTVKFMRAAAQSYSVLYSDSLLNSVWLKHSNIPAEATAAPISIPDSSAAGSATRFYRIVTPALP